MSETISDVLRAQIDEKGTYSGFLHRCGFLNFRSSLMNGLGGDLLDLSSGVFNLWCLNSSNGSSLLSLSSLNGS